MKSKTTSVAYFVPILPRPQLYFPNSNVTATVFVSTPQLILLPFLPPSDFMDILNISLKINNYHIWTKCHRHSRPMFQWSTITATVFVWTLRHIFPPPRPLPFLTIVTFWSFFPFYEHFNNDYLSTKRSLVRTMDLLITIWPLSLKCLRRTKTQKAQSYFFERSGFILGRHKISKAKQI